MKDQPPASKPLPPANEGERARVNDFVAGSLSNLSDVLGERVDYCCIMVHPDQDNVDEQGQVPLRLEIISNIPPEAVRQVLRSYLGQIEIVQTIPVAKKN